MTVGRNPASTAPSFAAAGYSLFWPVSLPAFGYPAAGRRLTFSAAAPAAVLAGQKRQYHLVWDLQLAAGLGFT